ncbi:protein-disulfide isomerase [Streptomyces sp. Ag109_G2-6]|uniref:DsbA family protein n=1 Tax=Streptomyces TaxID=1883 RepID=UPI0009A51A70|nr:MULTISPECIES: thioredoxin domain-containing protein [Streptomyces]RPF30062.1 protein-disulfide isomerase [Streptomyces sp. Ag109_G2-6]
MRAQRIRPVLVAVTLLGLTVTACGDQTSAAQRERRHPYAAVEELPEALAPDGTTIVVGDPRRMPVHIYEDMRCSVCREVEVTGAGASLLDMTLGKEARTEYTLSSALDDRLGGTGSKKAANALRAALEQGKFTEYRAVLLRNQPEEDSDGYTDTFLLETASRVEGLRGPAFDSAVKEMKYADFVEASEKAYEAAGAPMSPAADINGKRLPDTQSQVLLTKDFLPVWIAGYR